MHQYMNNFFYDDVNDSLLRRILKGIQIILKLILTLKISNWILLTRIDSEEWHKIGMIYDDE